MNMTPRYLLAGSWLQALAFASQMTSCSVLPEKPDLIDGDGDGFSYANDCDDGNAAINPDASDTIDPEGVDQNCDGVDGTDGDGDGYASAVTGGEDCNDEDPGVSPEAQEVCDDVDNDCDGDVDGADANGATTWYADQDGDGYGDPDATTTSCLAPDGYLDAAGDCDDDDGGVYPGADEACGDGVVNDCNGAASKAMADCGLGGTLSLADADLKLIGENTPDNAGISVAGVGHVDDDEFDDVLVGSFYERTGGVNAGAAYLLLGGANLHEGSATRDLGEADVKITGESEGDFAGRYVSGAGDTDGDGYDDLLLGAKGQSSVGEAAGAVYLILGGPSLVASSDTLGLAEADLRLSGEAAGDEAGWTVSGAGDVNGDGLHDVLIGAWAEDSGGTDAGAAYLVTGTSTIMSEGSEVTLSGDVEGVVKLIGEGAGDQAGSAVSASGDVDGDGLGDIFVGAYLWHNGVARVGAAYFLIGDALADSSNSLSLSDADIVFAGNSEGDQAGIAVCGAGDVDGDGLDDQVVGAYGEDSGGASAGAAFLLLSGGVVEALGSVSAMSLASADLKLIGEMEGDLAGRAVSQAGDLDGDQLADVLIGAYNEDSGGAGAGATYLLLGGGALQDERGTLSLSNADAKLTGESAGDASGSATSGAGDVDGDGFSDILVGAWNEATGGYQAGATYLILGGGY